tara:strand:+ start:12141 stop:13178 length:1038 start_codon:yes stop_codon:yes gene_type:complete
MANIYEKYAGLIPQLMPDPKQLQSLLSPQQTRLQAGLLGASSGVLPLMGVRDRPVGLGEVLLAAGTGAQAGIQQKEQSDLARALQGLELGTTLYEATRPPELSASDIITFSLPDGTTQTLTTQEFAALPIETRSQLKRVQISGTPSEIGGQKIETEIVTQLRDTGNLLEDIDLLVDVLKDPKTLTADIPSATVTAIDNIRNTIGQTLNLTFLSSDGDQISESEFLRKNKDLLEEIAGQSDKKRSLYTTIAYSIAKANNPDGRITDADFRAALDQIKGISNSPQNMISLLEMYRKRAEERAQSNLNFFNKINPNSGLPTSIFDLGITPYDYDQQLELENPLGLTFE